MLVNHFPVKSMTSLNEHFLSHVRFDLVIISMFLPLEEASQSTAVCILSGGYAANRHITACSVGVIWLLKYP